MRYISEKENVLQPSTQPGEAREEPLSFGLPSARTTPFPPFFLPGRHRWNTGPPFYSDASRRAHGRKTEVKPRLAKAKKETGSKTGMATNNRSPLDLVVPPAIRYYARTAPPCVEKKKEIYPSSPIAQKRSNSTYSFLGSSTSALASPLWARAHSHTLHLLAASLSRVGKTRSKTSS